MEAFLFIVFETMLNVCNYTPNELLGSLPVFLLWQYIYYIVNPTPG